MAHACQPTQGRRKQDQEASLNYIQIKFKKAESGKEKQVAVCFYVPESRDTGASPDFVNPNLKLLKFTTLDKLPEGRTWRATEPIGAPKLLRTRM